MSSVEERLLGLAQAYGYPGVFIVSLLGSVIPFIPLPYLFIVVLLSNTLDPLLLGISAGIGGSLGKITSYALGRGGYRLFGEDTKRRMDALRELIGKYGDIGVFIFALTPLPDDIYLIPVGMMRFSFWRFLLANTLGKIILSISVAYLGKTYFDIATEILGQGYQLHVTIAAVLVMVIITIFLLKIDWEEFLRIVKSEGIRGVLKKLDIILQLRRNKNR